MSDARSEGGKVRTSQPSGFGLTVKPLSWVSRTYPDYVFRLECPFVLPGRSITPRGWENQSSA
jgi:hypothetical protein